MHLQCCVPLIFVAITMPLTANATFVGDSCTIKSQSGVCKLGSECPDLEMAVRAGILFNRDIVHCGFTIHEEVICCPAAKNRSDDEFVIESTTKPPNDRIIPTRLPVRTSSTAIPPVLPRSTDRPAVMACREIEAGLESDKESIQHILSGASTDVGEFPYMAAIGYSISVGNEQGPYDYRCSGILIASRFVLTAAHCVDGRSGLPAVVLLGLVDINDEEERSTAQELPIRLIHIHPNFLDSSKMNDIAIIELETEVNFTSFLRPACLETEIKEISPISRLYALGWGHVEDDSRESDMSVAAQPSVLVKSRQLLDPKGCNNHLNTASSQPNGSFICTYDGGLNDDKCQGNSGGPLVMITDEESGKLRIIGITTDGINCTSALSTSVTRVTPYIDFIEKIVWPASVTA